LIYLPNERRLPASLEHRFRLGLFCIGAHRACLTLFRVYHPNCREDAINGIYIGNLQQKRVEDLKQMIGFVKYGLSNQGLGHSIFSILLDRKSASSVSFVLSLYRPICIGRSRRCNVVCIRIEGVSKQSFRWSISRVRRVHTTSACTSRSALRRCVCHIDTAPSSCLLSCS
jgi:hypothetical protein